MGWPNESSRHSLASRGIRTKAIPNPIANSKWPHKKDRSYSGSGLKNIEEEKVIEWVKDYINSVNRYSHEDYNDLDLEIESIYLVGSRVGGFYTKESDLDVLIIFKGDDRSDDKIYNELIGDYFTEVWRVNVESGWQIETIEIGGGKIIMADAFWGWKLPDDDLPYLKIWEAS